MSPDPTGLRDHLPAAVFCGAEHDITGALCSRLASVCDGQHSADGEDPWTSQPTPRAGGWIT